MAHELGIAGEFIYDSARKAMALRNLYNDYELNSILYNGELAARTYTQAAPLANSVLQKKQNALEDYTVSFYQ